MKLTIKIILILFAVYVGLVVAFETWLGIPSREARTIWSSP